MNTASKHEDHHQLLKYADFEDVLQVRHNQSKSKGNYRVNLFIYFKS